MALPFTISISPGAAGHNPPRKSSGGAFYSVIRTAGSNIDVYKATDPSDTWAIQDVANNPTDLLNSSATVIASKQEGDIIHIAYVSTGNVYRYAQFNMATDQWAVVSSGVGEAIDTPAQAPTQPWISIAVRSNGVPVVVYAGDTDQVMGGKKERVDVNVRTGGTWDGPIALDAGGDIHYGNPSIVKSPLTDEMHILWQQTNNIADPPTEWLRVEARTLRPSDDSLSTLDFDTSLDTGTVLLGMQNGVSYDDAGTQRMIWAGVRNALIEASSRTFYPATEDGGDDIVLGTSVVDTTDPDPFENGEVGIISIAKLNKDLHVLFSGGGANGADQDLYYTTSTDDGATWTTPTEEIDAITCNFISANIYTRGGGTVLAYVYDDDGDQKYNEKVLIAGGDFGDLVNPAQFTDDPGQTSSPITITGGVPSAGNLLVALHMYAEHGGGTQQLPTDNGTGVWADTGAGPGIDGSEGQWRMYWKIAVGDETIVTVNGSNAGDHGFILYNLIGPWPSNPVDVHSTISEQVGTAFDTGSTATTAVAASMAIVMAGGEPAITTVNLGSWQNGYIEDVDPSQIDPALETMGSAHKLLSATVAARGQATWSASHPDACGVIVVFSGVAAGGGPDQTADGSPSVTKFTASGTAEAIRTAEGGPSIKNVESAGTGSINPADQTANGSPSVTKFTATGVAEAVRTANGSPSITPVESSGTARQERSANGSPSTTKITAAGVAERILTSDGGPSIKNVEATGVGEHTTGGPDQTANGSPSINPVEAAGTAERELTADGSPEITPITATGAAERELTADGSPEITPITATGTAERELMADGSPSITPVEASGTAERELTADGSPSVSNVEATGVAERKLTADGSSSITPITSSGSARQERSANGSPSIKPIEASGAAEAIRTADGGPSTSNVEASGVAEEIRTGDGAPSITPVEASGVAEREITADGAPSITPVESSGTARQERSASGSPSTTKITAAGVAERELTADGSPQTTKITAAGTAAINPGGPDQTANGSPSITPITAAGTAERELTADGSPTTTPVEASGVAERELTSNGSPSITTVQASGTAGREITSDGAPSITPITSSGSARQERFSSGSPSTTKIISTGAAERVIAGDGSPSITPITAAGSGELERTADGSPQISVVESAGVAERKLTADGSPSISNVIAGGQGVRTSVKITDVNGTESWTDGDTGLVITGTGFV